MPTDQVQLVVSQTKAAPLDYRVPAAAEITPLSVFAEFDGSGAASAFRPTLEIISDSGHVVARSMTDSDVAAGGSANVSWFPRVAAAAAASGAANLPWAAYQGANGAFASGTVLTGINLTLLEQSPGAGFTNPTIGGVTGIGISVTGEYLAFLSCTMTRAGVGTAGARAEALLAGWNNFMVGGTYGTIFSIIPGSGNAEADPGRIQTARPSSVPSTTLQARQNSGANVNAQANVFVVMISSVEATTF